MRKYIYIGAGGIIGAILRFLIREIQLGRYEVNFPINTLIINVIGCFLLALIITVAFEILKFSSNLRIGITSGLLGAFTTFSTLCKETAGLISQEFYSLAVTSPFKRR